MSSHRSEGKAGFRWIKDAGTSLPIRKNLMYTSEAWGTDADNHLKALSFSVRIWAGVYTPVQSRQAVLWPDSGKGWVTSRAWYPSSRGDCHRQFQRSFSFFIVFVFLFFFLWQNKFQLFPNESFPAFCLLRLTTKERVCDKNQSYQSMIKFLLSAFITDLSSVKNPRFKQAANLKIDGTNALVVLTFKNYYRWNLLCI